jgi:hypothetical protein
MNWLTGAGSIFSLFGNYYRYDEGLAGTEIDHLSIAEDWQAVGDDIRAAIATWAKEHPPEAGKEK